MVSIKEVSNLKELRQFVKFPFSLYKNDPYWVPPLIRDEFKTFRKGKNPSLAYMIVAYFLACKDKKIVGRVAAIISPRANERWNNKLTRFGWIEFIDDEEVSGALLQTVEEWGKQQGMEGVHGPLGFTDFDPEGMLVDGFEQVPTIINPYNKSYYGRHLEKYGYRKAADWLQYKFNASQAVPEKVKRINILICQKYKLEIPILKSKKEILSRYAQKLFDTINASFADLYGFVKLSQKEIDYYIKNYIAFVRPELVCFVVDENDNVIGFGLSMPSLSKAFQKAKGHLFPFGFIHILKALHKYDTLDLYFNGVLPEWQHRGVHSLYYVAMNELYIKHKIKTAISSQQLEENINAVGIWDNYEKEFFSRRRCYIKNII